MPQDVIVVALDLNIYDPKYAGYNKLSARAKLDRLKTDIEKICQNLTKTNLDAKWIIAWREYGITEGPEKGKIDKATKDYLKEVMTELCKKYPQLIIIPGTVATKSPKKFSKLSSIKEYYQKHEWIRLIEEEDKKNPLQHQLSIHKQAFNQAFNVIQILPPEQPIPLEISSDTILIALENEKLSIYKRVNGVVELIKSIEEPPGFKDILPLFPEKGGEIKEILATKHEALFNDLASKLGYPKEVSVVRNTAYCFMTDKKKQIIIQRHDKIAPINESVEGEFYKPGGKKSIDSKEFKSLSTLFEINNEMVIGVEICREHDFGVLKREVEKKNITPFIHFIVSDPVSLNLENSSGKYVIQLDSMTKPELILMRPPTLDHKEHPKLYVYNVLDETPELVSAPSVYPYHKKLLDQLDKLITSVAAEPKKAAQLKDLKSEIEMKLSKEVHLSPRTYFTLKSKFDELKKTFTQQQGWFNFFSVDMAKGMGKLIDILEQEKSQEMLLGVNFNVRKKTGLVDGR